MKFYFIRILNIFRDRLGLIIYLCSIKLLILFINIGLQNTTLDLVRLLSYFAK